MSVEKSKMLFSFGGLMGPIAGLGLARKPKIDLGPTEGLEPLYQRDFQHTMSYSPTLGQISGRFKLLPAPADQFGLH
jgi:hypothetical protein